MPNTHTLVLTILALAPKPAPMATKGYEHKQGRLEQCMFSALRCDTAEHGKVIRSCCGLGALATTSVRVWSERAAQD